MKYLISVTIVILEVTSDVRDTIVGWTETFLSPNVLPNPGGTSGLGAGVRTCTEDLEESLWEWEAPTGSTTLFGFVSFSSAELPNSARISASRFSL